MFPGDKSDAHKPVGLGFKHHLLEGGMNMWSSRGWAIFGDVGVRVNLFHAYAWNSRGLGILGSASATRSPKTTTDRTASTDRALTASFTLVTQQKPVQNTFGTARAMMPVTTVPTAYYSRCFWLKAGVRIQRFSGNGWKQSGYVATKIWR